MGMGLGRRMLRGGLLATIAGLAALNWYLATTPIDLSPLNDGSDPAALGPANKDTSPPAATLPALADLTETVSRPLFHPSRRPQRLQAAESAAEAEAPVSAEAVAAAPSGLALVGVMGRGPGGAKALLRAEGQPYGTWVGVGGEIAGWRLSHVEDGRVVIEQGGTREELQLHRPGSR